MWDKRWVKIKASLLETNALETNALGTNARREGDGARL